MKNRSLLPLAVFAIVAVCFPIIATAATNTPVSVTGFNRDVVIENTAVGPPYTSYAQEFNSGEGTAFFQTNLGSLAGGLPLNGSFANTNDGTVYQLQPYTTNNVLDLNSDTGLTNGTLFLVTPKVYDSIAIIANSGNGNSSGLATVTLHFNDGTSYNTNYYAPDWFNNNNNANYTVALQGFQRINLTSGSANGAPSNPRFYQTAITLSNISAITGKRLSSLTFYKPAVAVSTGIYALSGVTNASQSPLTYTPATLTNMSASAVTTTSATLNGQVTSTGNDVPMVTLYYGTTDGGTNAAAWANSISVGWQTGAFSTNIAGLSYNTTYYFTAQAVNAGGTSWYKPSVRFTTPVPVPATVTNYPATSVLANSASLNGAVVNTGGNTPTVTFYYGPSNGGTNAAAWAHNIPVGMQSGSFTRGAFGLSPSSTYYFTVQASNAAGISWASPAVSFTTLATNPVTPPVAVFTQHNNNNRSGENLNETALNVSNVNTNTFGLLYTRPVDDQIYAQPLIATNLTIPGKGVHNVLYVCTVNDSVYAYDADDPTVVNPYWETNLIPPGAVIVHNTDMTGACGGNYHDFSGEIGIVGTPVIDPVANIMYLVARTIESGVFVQRLYALDLITGANRIAPVVISGTFTSGTNMVSWDPQKNNQRSALCLANGNIYIAWSSHCDWGPYHGWVMAYNASTLAQVATYCDTPTGSAGGIWMSGQGPAADTNGNIFISTGNGTADSGDLVNRGMSFLKLNSSTLSIMTWFTPFNYSFLNGGDYDLGAGGVMLIPGTTLAIGGGKSSSTIAAHLYDVQRDAMGGLGSTADTNIVQSIPVTPTGLGFNHIHGAPVWWDGPDGSYTYVWGESDHLHQYKFDKVNGVFTTPAYAQSPTPAWVNGMTGGMLSISANGTNSGTGILWGSHQFTGDANQAVRPGIVHAYDAQNVTNELWNSEQYSARDSVGLYAKFVPPTVANGKVYVATFSGRVNVYGLLPNVAPIIYQNPQSSTRFTGDTVQIAVAPGGGKPLFFQWYQNGNKITGATNSAYYITNLQYSDAGTYTCTISNSLGSISTTPAVLTVETAPTISYSQTVMADQPIAYWRLDETNGTIAHDSVGGHDGVYNNANLGAPGYNANDPDTAVEFGTLSLTGSYVGGIEGIDFSTFANNATFSIETWVDSESFSEANGAGIVTYGYGGGGEEFDLDCGGSGSGYRFSVRDAINVAHNASSSVIGNGTWQHVVGVCDEPNGMTRLYVNGTQVATASISGGIQMGTVPVSIGSRESGYNDTNFTLNYQGLIDEVSIYNYPLSATQVANHYLAGINPVTTLYMKTSGKNVELTWSPGTLQSSPSVMGPYTNVPNASSPYTITPTGAALFYRLQVK
ncbi:MAG TPA: LamG-like jellyroll fold domain-containing protein [Verrucomicrobiae bacterium]|nr:LamG-like jellyroll fold domain-containing protein [Verrucomicrobiae bacterium]